MKPLGKHLLVEPATVRPVPLSAREALQSLGKTWPEDPPAGRSV
ncbi:MAG: hypothetical protein WD066_13945 [Planctomycetaceae bacterium]